MREWPIRNSNPDPVTPKSCMFSTCLSELQTSNNTRPPLKLTGSRMAPTLGAFPSLKVLPNCYRVALDLLLSVRLKLLQSRHFVCSFYPQREFSPQRGTDGISDIELSVFVLTSQALLFFWSEPFIASVPMQKFLKWGEG